MSAHTPTPGERWLAGMDAQSHGRPAPLEPCRLEHATVQGIAGIVGTMADGVAYFFDYWATEKYPLAECPPVQRLGHVGPALVPDILARMRTAPVVHLPGRTAL